MIGDGGISRSSPTSNARFRVGHSIDKSEYLMWKLKHLREIVQITDIGVIKGGVYENSPNDYVYFNSRRDPVVTRMYERLYVNGEKVLSEELIHEIDDVALSVLFMDDGSYDAHIDNLNYWLHLNSHSKSELSILVDYLSETYGINPKFQSVNKGKGYALRFLRTDSERIDEIIRPIVSEIACMDYKLHFNNTNLKDLKWSNSLTIGRTNN